MYTGVPEHKLESSGGIMSGDHSTSPMPLQSRNERVYAPYKLSALIESAAEQGVPASDCLKGTGISAADLDGHSALISVRQYELACRNVLRFPTREETPFLVGRRLHLSAYGMYGYALLSCVTLREFCLLAVKYHQLATPTLNIEWVETPETVKWVISDPAIPQIPQDLRAFLLAQQFAQHVTHLQDVAGADCWPTAAYFAHTRPDKAEIYDEQLGCPCHFDADASELHYSPNTLEHKLQLGHRQTLNLVLETCERLIASAKLSEGVAGEVYRILMLQPGCFPSMNDVAETLRITARTLRRHLDDEGTSFMAIFDDVRRSLALEYLQTTKMTVDDIAIALGFNEASSFRRAFRKWTGESPGTYRD